MKGIVFSSDFIVDKSGNERLLEINTDTAFLDAALPLIDFTQFFNVLSSNNITKLNVVYKDEIHENFVNHLSQSVSSNASFIQNFERNIIAESNIFPTIPIEDPDTFVLRLAYDESAILDSEYAKGTLNLLKLFADNDDDESVCGFYHSSSIDGLYNTLGNTINDSDFIPDFVVKTTIERRKQADFYKLGKSDLSSSLRLEDFINTVSTEDTIIEQYHFNSGSVNENNKITSLRSYKIVYGSNLDIISLVDYQIESLFDLPTTLINEVTSSKIDNKLSSKHYYEFATNFTKKPEKHLGGLLDTHEILMEDGTQKQLNQVVVGDIVKSYYISGSPMRDNPAEVFAWSLNGSQFASGSYYLTSSYIENVFSASIANNIVDELKIGEDVIYTAPANVFLVYESDSDKIIYKRSIQINPSTDYLINNEGVTQSISENNMYILNDDTHQFVEIDVEEVDTYLIAGTENLLNTTFILTHNWYCFPAGTKVSMGNGGVKNIEDVSVGDIVLSYNEETKEIEAKKVIQTKNPIHNDLVRYELDNGLVLTSTFDHPIYVNGLELASFNPEITSERYQIGKDIAQIKVGDIVKLSNMEESKIVKIEALPEVDTQTYIITVEDNHNFYANNILVHNK